MFLVEEDRLPLGLCNVWKYASAVTLKEQQPTKTQRRRRVLYKRRETRRHTAPHQTAKRAPAGVRLPAVQLADWATASFQKVICTASEVIFLPATCMGGRGMLGITTVVQEPYHQQKIDRRRRLKAHVTATWCGGRLGFEGTWITADASEVCH